MSGWQYEASKEEKRAAALLREKGWTVSAPTCPDCHGHGTVSEPWSFDSEPWKSSHTVVMKPCPRGCQAAWYFTTTSSVA